MTGEPSGARRGGQDLGKEVGGVGGHFILFCGSWLLRPSWDRHVLQLRAATRMRTSASMTCANGFALVTPAGAQDGESTLLSSDPHIGVLLIQ